MVFEFKSAIRRVPLMMHIINFRSIMLFCIISDGVNNKAGSFFAPYDFYYGWRRIAGLSKDVDGLDFTLVQGC